MSVCFVLFCCFFVVFLEGMLLIERYCALVCL